jgi:hypothetical protein
MNRLRVNLAAVLLLAIVALVATAMPATSAPAKVPRPAALIESFTPDVVVKGTHFKKREKLTVTLSSTTIEKKWTKKVKATATGRFSADFGALPLSSCDQYTLKVVGSLKSRFTTSHSFVPC